MNAAGAAGLQLYSFGATVSIPFFRKDWRPDSFYDKMAFNASGGLHTLCLLDIKVREPDFDALVRTGRVAFEPPRFMTVNTAVAQLLEVEERRAGGVCGPAALAIGLARVGQDTQTIVSGALSELADVDFGGPLHSLVIAGTMHELERAMFDHFRVKPDTPRLPPPAPDADSGSGSDSDGGAA
jgi:diphthine synthase